MADLPGNLTWLVYLLECCDSSYYCGVTTDLERRLAEHNGEIPGGARYTSGRRPVKVLASAACADRAAACRLERKVKKAPKLAKEDIIRRAKQATHKD